MGNEQRLPGLGVLGCGYDATGYLADARSSRLRIFDLGEHDTTIVAPNNISYSLPGKIKQSIDLRDLGRGTFKSVSGESAESYRTSLNTTVKVSGSYGFFSSSVTSTFSREELSSFNHEFVSVRHHFDGWIMTLPDYSTLPMLESAKNDIDGALKPLDVIHKYGTHVLVSAIIGGRAEYNCFVDRSKFKSKLAISTIAEASYKGGLSLDVSVETKYQKEVEQFKKSSTYSFRTIGGDFEASFDPTSFSEWMISFKKHPVLVNFTDQSLVEIYKLASTDQRRKKLETAYHQYIEESQKLVPDNVPLLEVEVVSVRFIDFAGSDSGSGAKMDLSVFKPKLPAGWYWVGQAGNKNDKLIIVKPLVPGAVTEPLDYQCAWTDGGSGKDHGYSLWNITPQPEYLALGGIARLRKGRTDWAKPSGAEVEGLGCIHKSLCEEGQIGGLIWNDHGTHANADGSVWEIIPKDENAIDAKTFFCQSGSSKPSVKVYAIKKGERIKFVDNT